MDITALQATLRRAAADLLQIADHAQIALSDGPGAKTHVLIDWENVQPDEDACRRLVPEATDVWLFHGPNQKNVGARYPSFGARVTEVRIARTGKNALDFHLSFYVGYIASRQPQARFAVLSNDTGYRPMLDHARELGFEVSQIGFVRDKPPRPPAKKAAAKSSATTAPAPAKKAPAKKAGAKTPATKPVSPRAAAKGTAAKKAAAKAPTKANTRAPTSPPLKAPALTVALVPAKALVKKVAAATRRPAGSKTFEQILALLNKTPAANLPRRQARLLAYVASRIGGDDAAASAKAVLDRLMAEGKLTADTAGSVAYRL